MDPEVRNAAWSTRFVQTLVLPGKNAETSRLIIIPPRQTALYFRVTLAEGFAIALLLGARWQRREMLRNGMTSLLLNVRPNSFHQHPNPNRISDRAA